jgi:hypothetical protein
MLKDREKQLEEQGKHQTHTQFDTFYNYEI